VFNLNNNSKWYLKISLFEMEDDFSLFDYKLLDIKQRAQSIVSVLNLHNSSIVFSAPHKLVNGHYQTLHVGKIQTAEDSRLQENRTSNLATVYNAIGDAKIYFNTEWSDGLEKEQQKTDRLFVHGNVSGTTTLYFKNLSKNEETKEESAVPLNARGVSLVQVFGKAEESSFKLANGYTTMGGLPYKYMLNAYGPTSNRGKANAEQSLGGENKNFWDFRLQSATLDDEGEIRA
ncbi:autotransporter outer membrane beta-barrel domain-containing protein, partial [Bartonella sp. AA16SXTY]|uniref:autotransporter outer membrane beta-barrel domain-containing protein n=1 Tax=Bartonella sp. AA16SXTY TaxID=3243429 RepID=UPI0035D07FA8